MLSAGAMNSPSPAAHFVAYVSHGKSNDIHAFALDPASGSLTLIEKTIIPGVMKPGNSLPLAISPDRRFLYAAVRGEPFIVLSFSIDPQSGRLTYLGSGPLADTMAYIATDQSGRFLMGASYQGGRVALHEISPEGVAHSVRQVVLTEPKAHSIITDPANRFAHVASLGGDLIHSMRFDADAGLFAPIDVAPARAKAGAGPRHIVFHPQASRLYLINELDATVSAFDYAAETGALQELQTLSALPGGFAGNPWAADIHITPDGRFLYTSERTSSTLAMFSIDQASGRLSLLGHVETEAQPRAFAIDPSGRYLLSVGELSNSMTCYGIENSGRLRKLARYSVGDTPNWVEIITLPQSLIGDADHAAR